MLNPKRGGMPGKENLNCLPKLHALSGILRSLGWERKGASGHDQRGSHQPVHLAATAALIPWQPPPPDSGGGGQGGDGIRPQPLHNLALHAAQEVVLTLASFAVTKLAYVHVTKAFRELYMRRPA
jgi:hypothetical protein